MTQKSKSIIIVTITILSNKEKIITTYKDLQQDGINLLLTYYKESNYIFLNSYKKLNLLNTNYLSEYIAFYTDDPLKYELR
ncbi:MAG: hypothetical protein ACK5HR_02335 [Mycoplasmatales bacterium]